jgi:Zn-dependent oligopeptidase
LNSAETNDEMQKIAQEVSPLLSELVMTSTQSELFARKSSL